jgi:hypothetical protein
MVSFNSLFVDGAALQKQWWGVRKVIENCEFEFYSPMTSHLPVLQSYLAPAPSFCIGPPVCAGPITASLGLLFPTEKSTLRVRGQLYGNWSLNIIVGTTQAFLILQHPSVRRSRMFFLSCWGTWLAHNTFSEKRNACSSYSL